MQSAHDNRPKPTDRRNKLENAVDAVIDLLDPDVEPRTVIDAINLMDAINLAIKFVRARPEFLDLNDWELEEIHSQALNRINWRS